MNRKRNDPGGNRDNSENRRLKEKLYKSFKEI